MTYTTYNYYYYVNTTSDMASLVKDGLEKLWKESPLKFDNFKYVPQDKVDSLIQKFPKNFAEKTWDTDDEQDEDPPEQFSGKKSPAAKGIDPNDWCQVLHLKSGDNDRANHIYNTVNTKFNRTITWVSKKYHNPMYILCNIVTCTQSPKV